MFSPFFTKLYLQFKLLFLSRVLLVLSFLLLSYSLNAQELTAITAHKIEGNLPYIELNGIKAKNLSQLLSINVNGVIYTNDWAGRTEKVNSDGSKSIVQSITLANIDDKFSDVLTIAPADGITHALNDISIIPYASLKDDDGDEPFILKGNILGEWRDKFGELETSNLSNRSPNVCKSPYTLTLWATNSPTISTKYGYPYINTYGNGSSKYIINPLLQPSICLVKPVMNYGVNKYAGPINMWDPNKGFILQSTNSSTYYNNFPTTGANKLYFDLIIEGSSTTLNWPDVTVGGIKAKTSNISATSVRVTLEGPAATKMQKENPTPTLVNKPTLPAKFELKGLLNGETVVTYGFEINKWFINRGTETSEADVQGTWCEKTGYRKAMAMDLSNAHWDGSQMSMPIPSGYVNNYKRQIGGGLFSEWGRMYEYEDASFLDNNYWVAEMMEDKNFVVNAGDGRISTRQSSDLSLYTICTYP